MNEPSSLMKELFDNLLFQVFFKKKSGFFVFVQFWGMGSFIANCTDFSRLFMFFDWNVIECISLLRFCDICQQQHASSTLDDVNACLIFRFYFLIRSSSDPIPFLYLIVLTPVFFSLARIPFDVVTLLVGINYVLI